jgi:hypothetical protein
MEDSQVKEIGIELRKALSDASMTEAIDKIVRPTVIRMVNERTMRGEFLGGPYANKGYSTATLPAFFFGRLSGSGNQWSIRSDQLNTSVQPGDDLIWHVVGGSAMAFLIGGYKKFRELAGRNTGTVDLTFTGTMLRGLDVKTETMPDGVVGKLGVYNERAEVAGFVDAKREFLGLSEQEQNTLKESLDRFTGEALGSE